MANTHSLDLEASSSQYAYITDANQTGLDVSTDISMEAWVKFETTGVNQVIMGKWGPNIRQYLITTLSTNKLSAVFSDNGTENAGHIVNFTTNDAVVADTGVWYHIAVTFDISEETCIIYINGESVANTKTGSIGSNLYSGTANFLIGQQNNAQYLDGLIDEVRVWNDVRTPTEIADNYKKELVGNEAGLVGYWKFNNDATDTTSNNNDLTLSGSPSYSTDVPPLNLTLAVDKMALALTYADVTLKKAIKLVVDTMALSFTFADVIFNNALTLIVDKMALSLTYADVTLKKAIKLVVDTMALSFTFADVIFNNALTLIVDTMALSLTYADVTLKKAVKLVVDTMSLVLDFKNVILKKIGWTNDTKPSDTWTNDTKPSDTWTNDSK